MPWIDVCKGVRYNTDTGTLRCRDTEFAPGDIVYNSRDLGPNKVFVRYDARREHVELRPVNIGRARACHIESFRDLFRLSTDRKDYRRAM